MGQREFSVACALYVEAATVRERDALRVAHDRGRVVDTARAKLLVAEDDARSYFAEEMQRRITSEA